MNFLECLKKVKELPIGTNFRRKNWANEKWQLSSDKQAVLRNNELITSGINLLHNLLAEDWEIVEEKPKLQLTDSQKNLIEAIAFTLNANEIPNEYKEDKKWQLAGELSCLLKTTTENFWQNIGLGT